MEINGGGGVLRATNSEVNSLIWLNFENIWDFIPFLTFCKLHEVLIKNELDKPRTAISVTDTKHRDGNCNTRLEALYKVEYRNKTYTTCI